MYPRPQKRGTLKKKTAPPPPPNPQLFLSENLFEPTGTPATVGQARPQLEVAWQYAMSASIAEDTCWPTGFLFWCSSSVH